MNYFQLYFRFIIVYLRSRMEYRFSFFMDVFVQIITYLINFLGIWIMLNHFKSIQGWSLYEVLFIYNLNLISYGISGLFIWSPMRQLEGMVQSGEFDGILTKPINSFLHIIFKQFNHAFIGHIVLGGIVFYICNEKLNIDWTVFKLAMFILVIIGATLIQSSIMIISGCISFWIVKSTAIVDTMIYGFRSFINYPISIYHTSIQIFLTFILPYGFINFYPSLILLNKGEQSLFYDYFQYGTPVLGIVLFILSLFVWSFSVNKYQSAGS